MELYGKNSKSVYQTNVSFDLVDSFEVVIFIVVHYLI